MGALGGGFETKCGFNSITVAQSGTIRHHIRGGVQLPCTGEGNDVSMAQSQKPTLQDQYGIKHQGRRQNDGSRGQTGMQKQKPQQNKHLLTGRFISQHEDV